MRSIALILFIGIFPLCPHILVAETGGDNWIGANLSYVFQPVGFEDPYSGPLGIGVYYERHRVFRGLSIGGQFTYYGFYPLRSDFGRSFMLVGGLKAGYEFSFPIERRFTLCISPYLSGRYYWRRFDYQGGFFSAVRPLLAAGADLDLLIQRRSLLGVNLEVILILDEALRVTIGQGQRIGVRF